MNQTQEKIYDIKENGFVSFEYKNVSTNINMISFIVDGYKNFGWELDENIPNQEYLYKYAVNSGNRHCELRMKRNKNLVNKTELTRLQRNYDACVKDIERMETMKTSKAMSVSLAVGILGTVFMAGSVFAVTATPPIIWLSVILAVPAFAGWILPVFIYKYISAKDIEMFNPIIADKYAEIEEICRRGYRLLEK
ncbi:MAG: hypothetical protein ACI4D8_03790 [Wujia sp.]